MSGKGGKAAEPPSMEEKVGLIQKQLEKKMAALSKVLVKKCKISKDAMYVLLIKLLDAQFAMDFRDKLPFSMDPKVGQRYEFLALASTESFNREELEHVIAFFKGIGTNVLQEQYWSSTRIVHLQQLAVQMNSNFTYTQAISYKYGLGLKRLGDSLAKSRGAAFAKAWRPKAAASIFTKLYFRRGATVRGWLSDAQQGRITCDSIETVARVTELFRDILAAQNAAAADAGRSTLSDEPTGDEILRFDVSSLSHPETDLPVDRVSTWLPDLPEEDASSIGQETIVVYRVKECACCQEVEGMEAGEVMLVNLMLMCPPARRTGMVYKMPEQNLACTFEIQVSTAGGFKKMAKGLDAHDRTRLVADESSLIGKLQALSSGSQGKIAMPGVGKGGVTKGGSPENGKRMLDIFNAIDVMHPAPESGELVTFTADSPEADKFTLYERDREMPGSRWIQLWASKQPLFSIQALTLKTGGKVPTLGKFSLLLSGVLHDGGTVSLFEEMLIKLPVSKGEVWLVQDGFLPSGQLLGNLSGYKSVKLEYFEHLRGFQWVDLTDITIKAVVQQQALGDADGEDRSADSAAMVEE